MKYKRILTIPKSSPHSFFLWGPRQTGKSTLLRDHFPQGMFIDLLDSREFRQLTLDPSVLEARISASSPNIVIVDEVQKIPELLDEVHRLITLKNVRFGLCGSSARKVRRGHANLLGGRAIRFELLGLVSAELGETFNLERALNHGNLALHYLEEDPTSLLSSYISDYLREEIAAEGLVRNLPAFAQFLDSAALADSEILSYSSFARDVGVSVNTIREYFQILVDTMLGRFLPPYVKKPKRRVFQAPKFYFSNVAVVNTLARRGVIRPGSDLFGKALENWIAHEFFAYSIYSKKQYPISYWRLTSGAEVDFILGDMEIAVEVKSSSRIRDDHLRSLRTIVDDHPYVKRRIVICLEQHPRKTNDGIEIIPCGMALEQLWTGKLI